ncbi:MAG: ACP S-malonyltransferase [Candidatus Sumerlaeia bacterium]|nr:ACP S-malonyltransferase [Candidatus Sumerlaeia bacterium]
MSKKIAFVFPGQGSQEVGMGKALFEGTEIGRRHFEQAAQVLGFDLASACFSGPEEALKRTGVAQPALFTHGVICGEWLRAQGITPTHAAGHSLGEYTALCAAGVFDFATGLALVKARGEAMNQASEATKGVMSAILGLSVEVLDRLCQEAQAHGVVTVANINAPGQVVISGEPDAVDAVEEAAKTAGAKRVVRLVVHGAFHSPLMATAAIPMRKALAAAALSAPQARFVANTTGGFLDNPGEIRDQLAAQITGCVRWVDCVTALADDGVEMFIELGPGAVLAGLIKRIRKGAVCLSAGDPESLGKIVEAVRAGA